MAKTQNRPNKAVGESDAIQSALIPMDLIRIEDQMLRHNPEDDGIIELAQDIAQKGLLQPIGVRLLDGGGYQLLWGGRRFAAHKRLNKATIWAHVWGDSEIPVKALALVENLQRVNLSLVEEVEAVNYLHNDEQKSPDQISSLLSKGRSWVMRRLAIPNLPPELRAPVLEGDVAVGVAEEIAIVPHDGFRKFLLSQAMALRWTIVQTRTACQTYIQAIEDGNTAETAKQIALEPHPPSAIFLTCAQCGGLKPEDALALIRVCLGGCNPNQPAVVDGAQITKEA